MAQYDVSSQQNLLMAKEITRGRCSYMACMLFCILRSPELHVTMRSIFMSRGISPCLWFLNYKFMKGSKLLAVWKVCKSGRFASLNIDSRLTDKSGPSTMQCFMKALVVLPFVALVKEKADHLKDILQPLGCQVKGYFGNDDLGRSTPLTERWDQSLSQ